MDIALQTMQINAEKRKISFFKLAIEDISKAARILIKDKYLDRAEWGIDEEKVKQYRKEKSLISASIKSRNLRAALEELTLVYNSLVSVSNNTVTRKRIDVSSVMITEE